MTTETMHPLTDDEYRVLRWYSGGWLAGRFRSDFGETPRWTETARRAYRRLVRLGYIDEDWTTTVTDSGLQAMRRHRRGSSHQST